MDDFDFGVVYLIENAQQFWLGECHLHPPTCLADLLPVVLDDILRLPPCPTLLQLDSFLNRFTSICAEYHGPPFRVYIPFPIPYIAAYNRAVSPNLNATGTCLQTFAPVRLIPLPFGKDVR